MSQEQSLEDKLNYPNEPGRHSKKSPVVGARLQEIELVSKTAETNPVLLDYERELYKPDRIYLIPKEQRAQADVIAKQIFQDYIKKYQSYGITEDNAVATIKTGMPGAVSNKTWLSDIENQWNTWNVQAIVEANNGIDNERGKGYLPPDLVKYHELMHVEEIPKGISKKDDDARKGVEILTTTKTVMLEDYVYKKINNIPMDAVVDYHQSLKLGGKDVPLGQVAVFYEKLEQKYGNLGRVDI